MGRGYVKIHRELMDHPVFAHDGLFRLWTYCLMRANWKDANWMIPGTSTPVLVKRGQFITGREALHAELYGSRYSGSQSEKPDARTVWRWLESLKKCECINTVNLSNRGTLVTVCNYETYQDGDSDDCPTENNVTPQKIIASNRFGEQEHKTDSECDENREFVSSQKETASNDSETTCNDSSDCSCPTGVQPVSNRCPTGVQPVSTNKESKEGKKNKKVNNTPPSNDVIDQEVFASAFKGYLPESLDSDEFRNCLAAWMRYKKERRQPYKPAGLAAMVSRAANLANEHGVKAVMDAMERAAANQWAGWDQPNAYAQKGGRSLFGAGQTHDPTAAQKDPNHGRM